MRKIFPLMAFVTVLSVASCDSRNDETTLQRVKRTGTIRIAYANEAPFGYYDTATGEVTGEAPEIARVILKRLGVTSIEAKLVDFGQLIPGLRAGRYDLIAAGMYITPERAKTISFSNPTYGVGEAFLVKSGNPKNLHSFEDVVAKGDAKLGVVNGTVELKLAEDLGVPDSRLMVFPDNATALTGVKTGHIDAFSGTALTVLDLLKKAGDGLERAEPFRQPKIDGRAKNYGAFGFRKDDHEFLDAFNAELAKFIGTPEHIALIARFGFTKDELPGNVKASDITGNQ